MELGRVRNDGSLSIARSILFQSHHEHLANGLPPTEVGFPLSQLAQKCQGVPALVRPLGGGARACSGHSAMKLVRACRKLHQP